MNSDNTKQAIVSNWVQVPSFDLRQVPARLSKQLWVNPTEFLLLTHALMLADWALSVARRWRPCLPELPRRGPKAVYQDRSILVMALLQVAWQLSYEEIVNYLRARPEAASAAGFAPGRVISVGQYWQRRRPWAAARREQFALPEGW